MNHIERALNEDMHNMNSKMPDTKVLDNIIDDAVSKSHVKSGKSKIIIRLAACVAFVLLAFVITINISTAVAYHINKIAGLDKIVELLNFSKDKGLSNIIEGKIGQYVEQSVEKEGFKLTVHEVISTSNSFIVFYTFEIAEKYKEKYENDYRYNVTHYLGVSGAEKKHFAVINSGDNLVLFREGSDYVEFEPLQSDLGNYKIGFDELIVWDRVEDEEFVISGPFFIDVTVDKSKAGGKEQEIPIAETIKSKKGEIFIEKAIISPIETYLYVKFNPYEKDEFKWHSSNAVCNQTKGIAGLYGIVLKDQHGDSYTCSYFTITNEGGVYNFPLIYPNTVNEIYIESVIERKNESFEVVLDSIDFGDTLKLADSDERVITLKQYEDYNKGIKIGVKLSNIWSFTNKQNDPFLMVHEAYLEDEDGNRSIYKLNFRKGGYLDRISNTEKYQLLIFDNENINKDSKLNLVITEFIGYTQVDKTIQFDNQ